MSRLTVGSLEGLSENSNVISVPTGHTLNVADAGALQIGGSGVGLVHISRTTIGSAVSSVTVSGAFSADYDNYRILLNAGSASSSDYLSMRLGEDTSSNYNNVLSQQFMSLFGSEGFYGTGLDKWVHVTYISTTLVSFCMDIRNPYATSRTSATWNSTDIESYYHGGGTLNTTTSYTGFTVLTNFSTLTGGYIDVYGYAKS